MTFLLVIMMMRNAEKCGMEHGRRNFMRGIDLLAVMSTKNVARLEIYNCVYLQLRQLVSTT